MAATERAERIEVVSALERQRDAAEPEPGRGRAEKPRDLFEPRLRDGELRERVGRVRVVPRGDEDRLRAERLDRREQLVPPGRNEGVVPLAGVEADDCVRLPPASSAAAPVPG